MLSPLIKICGISDTETLAHTSKVGADFVGFVYFAKSPRHLDLQVLAQLINATPSNSRSVVVLVNPDDALLDALFALATPDFLQLHGDESPARALEIKTKYHARIIKAVGVSSEGDIAQATSFADVADIILFDAKPPANATNAGGLGISFDWKLLAEWSNASTVPWMLSGGLCVDNVAAALTITGAPMVDASSHLEDPVGSGKKSADKIRAFIEVSKL